MDVIFQKIDELASQYPKPEIPIYPYLGISSFQGLFSRTKSNIFQNQGIHFLNARNALAHAMILSGVNEKCSVLLPAYHCGSMVEPALWLKGEVIFYHLKPDLTPDLDNIQSKVKDNTIAIVTPHYFGFPQKLNKLKSWSKLNKINLIEDCAHSFWGMTENQVIGSVGDYAIASNRKFFPCAEEGILVSSEHEITKPEFSSQKIKNKLKIIKNCIESSLQQVFGSGLIFNKNTNVDSKDKVPLLKNQERTVFSIEENENFKWFFPETLYVKPTWFAKIMTLLNMTESVAEKRRENYKKLLYGTLQLTRASSLFKELPDESIPYMFPLILHYPEEDFPKLKYARLPVFRWDELAESDCFVSQDYRLKLIQLPCHQSLNKKQIDKIVTTIQRFLK